MDKRTKLYKVSPEAYKKLKRFDMERKPSRQWNILRPITWLLSFPDTMKHRLKITRRELGGLKPPFLLLSNHMGFIDFKVVTVALFPWRSNYVVAIDGFIGRENLLRFAGGMLKRRVISDLTLLRHLKQVLSVNKDIVTIYPEARYTHIGTTAFFPDNLAKFIRHFKVPVVMLRMHGNYLTSPIWNIKERNVPLEAEIWKLFSAEDLQTMGTAEISKTIHQAFEYDEYRWQKEQGIRIDVPFRAEGLHKVIYRCPACEIEFQISSSGAQLKCEACGKSWTMSEYGEMSADDGETEFSHLPDWYEYQVDCVHAEIQAGTYRFEDDVRVESLVNVKGYFDLGTARVIHDCDGFRMDGDKAYLPETIYKKPRSMYSCHIEYEYYGKGDCFELSTMDETWYLYPLNKMNAVTKIHIATEELYKLAKAGK